ncbi:unnamed protein product [Hermetia illucens]|uniref:Uncharacterized protein n=1 Tax=Hermetia illucens TaxID=343691 RepID=A0A7R8YZ47_HERIL|nr:putative leucine-rich repeat-containing protein DDB_G0290503 [Hermetia illucens]CAD7090844.1 unnamed protein product [Hermetia illucens]
MGDKYLNVLSLNSLGNGFQVNMNNDRLRESEDDNFIYTTLLNRVNTLVKRCADTLDIQENLEVPKDANLTNVFTILEDYLEQVFRAYSKVSQQVESLRDENSKIKADNTAKIKLIAEIESRLSASKKQLDMLRSGNIILEQRSDTFRKQIEKYKKDMRRLNKEHDKTKLELSGVRKKHDQIKREYSEKIDELTVENLTFEAELIEAQRAIKTLSEEQTDLEKRIQSHEKRSSELMIRLQEKTTKISGLEEINEKLLSTMTMQIQRIRLYDNENAADDEPVQLLEAGKIKLQQDFESQMKHYIKEEIRSLNEEVAKEETERKQLVPKSSHLETELAAAKEKIHELTTELSEAIKSRDYLKHQITNMEFILSKNQVNLQGQELNSSEENRSSIEAEKYSLNQKVNNEIRALLKFACTSQDGGRGDELLPDTLEDPIQYLQEKLTSLLSTNAHLTKTDKDLREVIYELENQGADLRQSNDELKDLCQTLKSEIIQSERKIQSLKAENFSLSATTIKLTRKIEELQNDNAELVQTNADVDTQTQNLSENISSICSERDKLVNEITILEDRAKELEYMLMEKQNEIKDHITVETELKSKLSELEKYIMQLAENRTTLQRHLEESESYASSLKQEKDRLNEELFNISQSSNQKATIIETLESERAELLAQIEEHSKELVSMRHLEEQLIVFQEQISSLKLSLDEKEAAQQADLAQIRHLTDLLRTLQPKQEHLEEVAVARQEQIKELENKIASIEASLEDSVNTNLEWQHAMQVAEVECCDFTEKNKQTIQEFQNRIEFLEKEKVVLKSANQGLLENFIKMGATLRQTQSINNKLLAQVEQAAQLVDHEKDYVNLQMRYVGICAEKEKLEAAKMQLEKTCEKLYKRIDMLTMQSQNLQDTADNLANCNDKSRAEIETLYKTFVRYKSQSEDLQKQLDATQRELRAANNVIANIEDLHEKQVARNAVLEDEIQCLRHEIEDALPQYQQNSSRTSEDIETYRSLYDEEVAKNISLSSEIQQLRIRLDNKNLEVDDQSQFLRQVESDLESKLELIRKLNIDLYDIKEENEKLHQENSRLQGKIDSLTSIEVKLIETQNLLDTMARESQEFNSDIAGLITSRESLKTSVNALTNVKHELEQKVEKVSSELEKANISVDKIQIDNMDLQRENTKLKAIVKNLYQVCIPYKHRESGDSGDNFDEMKSDQLLKNVLELRSTNEELEDKLNKLTSDLKDSHDENVELTDRISGVSSTLQSLEKRNLELLKDLEDLQINYDTLSTQKEALQNENLKITSNINALEMRRNEMIRHHISSNDQLSEKVREFEALKKELESIKSEKDRHLLECSEKLAQLERERKEHQEKLTKEQEQSEQLKNDVAILQAKLMKSRQLTEERERQWEVEREKLASKLQTNEKRIKDYKFELKNRFENMRDKATQSPSENLPRMDLINAFLQRQGKIAEACASLRLLSQTDTRIDSFDPCQFLDWRQRWQRAFKYPFVMVVFNIILTVLVKYALSKNDLEIIIRRTVPASSMLCDAD